jgi:serine protease Do
MQFAFRTFLTAAVAAAIVYCGESRAYADEPLWSELPPQLLTTRAEALPDFADLAEQLIPSVVSIYTEAIGEKTESGDAGAARDPFEEFRGFGVPGRSLGSGFIISKDGYILTNEHVVKKGGKVTVTTQRGENYTAEVIGRDGKADVALLKINAKRPLPVAPLGDSDGVRVGQWVMAIGSPFGFTHSVTVGIVSAKGRFVPGNFNEFIQTDASINQGNSGGPLIDSRGQVVGINAAIFTRTGVNQGIGFAIPINLVKEELSQLRETGTVTRGWLGVWIQKVTPELAETLGLPAPRGALVREVLSDGPAISAGIKRGDVIVAFDGKEIDDSRELPLLVGRTPLGHTARVKVIRDKAVKELAVTITESKEAEVAARTPDESGKRTAFGLYVRDLSEDVAREYGVENASGVLVTSVTPGSLAEKAGLRPRDVIVEVNRAPVADVESYNRAIAARAKGRNALLLVKRGEQAVYVAIEPEG